MAGEVVVALDCGTHAVRVVAYEKGTSEPIMLGSAQLNAHFPKPGHVEIDANMVSSLAIRLLRDSIAELQAKNKVPVCLGITNMRETAVSWHATTGKTLHDAVHWMSLQSEPQVERWANDGTGDLIRLISGTSNHTLYFGSKIRWLLDNNSRAAAAAEAGELRTGTLESWLIKELSKDSAHVTDVSNASRYQLMDLRGLNWSESLCEATGIPMEALPKILPTSGVFGVTDPDLIGAEIPITGVIADQQSSLFGHQARRPGDVKATFGTSGVVCLNLGQEVRMVDGLVTSVAWSHPSGNGAVYEIEASAFHSGSTINWLSSRLSQTNPWATSIEPSILPARSRPYVIPAFSQLGAPRWPKKTGGAILGLGLDTTPDDIIRAGFESMVYQTYDSLQVIGERPTMISVDGGGAVSEYMCQTLANLTQTVIVRPSNPEITSFGIAQAAVIGLGENPEKWLDLSDPNATVYKPEENNSYSVEGYEVWSSLVDSVLS